MRKSIIFFSLIIAFLLTASTAYAHVTVKPGEVGVGARTNFTVSVPTEEEVPTTEVRLVIPEGLQSVRPNVKPGWSIELKSEAEGIKGDILNTGEEAPRRITEIIWSGGSIPAEQRDEFIFSAQVPAEEQSLVWKAYQTYEDGKIVAWDSSEEEIDEYAKNNRPMEGEDDHNAPNPYSVTKVINDLKEGSDSKITDEESRGGNDKDDLPLILSSLAVLMSGVSLWMNKQKKK